MRVEGVGAKVSCLEDDSGFGNGAVVRTADEGDVDVVGGLENRFSFWDWARMHAWVIRTW